MNLSEVLYFMPIYDETGRNVTKVMLLNGDVHIINLSVKQYIYGLLASMSLDKRSLRNWTYSVIHSKHTTPLAFTQDLIFLPVKMRPTLIPADGCIGYVLMSALHNVSDFKLELASGISLETYSSAAYVVKKIKDGRHLQYAYAYERKATEFMRQPPNWPENEV